MKAAARSRTLRKSGFNPIADTDRLEKNIIMRGANVVASIAALLWLIAAMIGGALVSGVADRVGRTDPKQVAFGVTVPLIIVVALAACAFICNKFPRFEWVLSALSISSLLLLLGFCTYASGGV